MEQNNGMQLRDPTQGERFKWFAISHFSISIIGVIGMFISTIHDGAMVAVLFLWEAILLALYVAAGVWAARKRNWNKPQRVRDGILAFLSPALVAWLWGGLFLFVTAVPGIQSGLGDAGDLLAMGLMWLLLIFAFPSSWGFAILFMLIGAQDTAFNLIWILIVVGGLPPALFLLGSIWGSRKKEKIS